MNKILVLAENKSDLSEIILKQCKNSAMYSIEDENVPFDNFDAVCILGGTEEKNIILPAYTRIKVEKMIEEGKPVFAEFILSLCGVYGEKATRVSHHRMVYSDEYVKFADLSKGDILDGHYNDVTPYYFIPSSSKPILTYHDYICAHDHIEMDSEKFRSGKWALWFLNDNTLISSMRICNFNRARFAPRDNWLKIIQSIIDFLSGETFEINFPNPVCKCGEGKKVTCAVDAKEAILRGLNWYKNADMLKNSGKKGVYEGFSHHISARDGKQVLADAVRVDCVGETGGAFLFDYLLTGNKESYEIFKNIESFCFDYMQIKDGKYRGMLRWTEVAWEVCYGDDVARAILPTLFCQNFGEKSKCFENALEALSFLLETTGEDGVRVHRMDCFELTEERKQELKKAGVGSAGAHDNGYYHAALLLATRAGADKKYADVAVRGLTTIMKRYPDTVRATSETEELCRLIFPLALLYEYTGEKEHYNWLFRVTKDLEKMAHFTGGYVEWDTGYKARRSRKEGDECSLLANNGDAVADLLYANNWLPLGFSYAYMVTKEEIFYEKWKEIATFLLNCQLKSDDKLLDGAWTRAIDLNRMEVYGVPHDIGWAPCCIETGWTVAEILMGLQFMAIAEKHK